MQGAALLNLSMVIGFHTMSHWEILWQIMARQEFPAVTRTLS